MKIGKDNFMDFPVLSEKWQMEGNLSYSKSALFSHFSDCCSTGFWLYAYLSPIPFHKTDISLIDTPDLLLFQDILAIPTGDHSQVSRKSSRNIFYSFPLTLSTKIFIFWIIKLVYIFKLLTSVNLRN